MPDAQVPAQNPAPVPNPQVVQPTTSSGISWKKILLTVLVAMVVVGLIAGALWYFVLGKSDTDSTGSVTVTPPTRQSTPSAKKATPSAKKDETADWKTYTNAQNKYSLRYPPTWILDDRGPFDPGCAGEPPYQDVVDLFIHNDPNLKCVPISTHGYQLFNIMLGKPYALRKYPVGSKRGCEGAEEVAAGVTDITTKIKIDTVEAIKITRNYNNCVGYVANTNILFNHNNRGFYIGIPVNNDGTSDRIYDLIVSTFKFLD